MFTSCKDTDDDMYYGVQKTLGQRISDLEQKLAGFPDDYLKKAELKGELDALKVAYKDDVENVEKQVEALEKKVDDALAAIKDQLEKYIADITLNQTWNPMFGTINLPVGLSSTIAANYYGENTGDEFKFPSIDAAAFDALGAQSGYYAVGETRLRELIDAGVNQFTVPAGAYMNTDDEGLASLGKLYLSVNPTSVVIDDKITFSLVNSQDEAAKVEAFTLTPSDKTLMFGVSRAADNGFYETELKVSPDNAEALKVNIDVEALKDAMKSAIKDHSKSDLADFAKIMMDQMKDLMPAYAVKATWDATAYPAASVDEGNGDETEGGEVEGGETEGGEGGEPEAQQAPTRSVEDGKYTYISKYEIAATTVKPLGYMFLEGIGSDKKLPSIGSLEEAINKVFDNLNITIADINFDPENLSIKINLDGVVDDSALANPNKKSITLTYDPTVNKVDEGKDGVGALNDLVKQINDELGKVSGNINGSIQEALDNIKNRLEGKLSGLNNLLSLYNNLASRINNFLADPNHYLQVMMAYEGQDGQLHQLSATKAAPSHFSGDGVVTLYPTSYTAELIAPSCKKYVAISNAWNNGVAKSFDDIKALNTNDLNKVISGAQQEVALDASTLEKGVVYEVLYSSLDYQGHTSTRTFYFTVD